MSSNKTPPTLNIPADKLGLSGFRGELSVIAIHPSQPKSDAERLNDNKLRTFSVAARLGKLPLPLNEIKGDFTEKDGSSYLNTSPGAKTNRAYSNFGVFEIKANDSGEVSLIELECPATSGREARDIFMKGIMPYLDYLAYHANCPLLISALRIEDKSNLVTYLDFVSPYQQATINPQAIHLFDELLPIYAMYREAKNSRSDFYSFLCYHKIMEGLLGSLRTKLNQKARSAKVTISQTKARIPDSPHIPSEYQKHIGTSIKDFFDNVLDKKFRTAVAHFISRDGSILNLSDPKQLDRYATILPICELSVRVLIDAHENSLRELNTPNNQ